MTLKKKKLIIPFLELQTVVVDDDNEISAWQFSFLVFFGAILKD